VNSLHLQRFHQRALLHPDFPRRHLAVGRKALLLRDVAADAGAGDFCRRSAHEAGEMNCPAPLPKAKFKITADSFIYSAQCLLLRN
jgi:hypothetical protein